MKNLLIILVSLLVLACTEREIVKPFVKSTHYYRLVQHDFNGDSIVLDINAITVKKQKSSRQSSIDWSSQNIEVRSFTEVNSLHFTNHKSVNVFDTLFIFGDLKVDNGCNINIQTGGCIIIGGDAKLRNNANISINGTLYVVGEYDANNNCVNNNNNKMYVCNTPKLHNNSVINNNTITYGIDLKRHGYYLTCDGIKTPVRLIDFNIRYIESENANLIEFITTQEINSDYISLQYSDSSLIWKELIKIKSNNNISVNNYKYVHEL